MSIEAADRAAVTRFIRMSGAGVVATVGPDGEPQAAYVGLTADADGTLVFDAIAESRKVRNISERPRVAVAVTDADTTVQLEGRARIAHDQERQRLGDVHGERFPTSRALDDGFAVLAVDVGWVRVYDAAAHPQHITEARWI